MNVFDTPPKKTEIPEPHGLYRGVWADHVIDGQELPVGGSGLGAQMDKKLKLDFSVFTEQLSGVTEKNIRSLFEKDKASVLEWLSNVGSDADPYLFYVARLIQNKMVQLLEAEATNSEKHIARRKLFAETDVPKLSDLKGTSECAERAAFGQYLLQLAGLQSSYVAGVTMDNAKDEDEFPVEHSYLVVAVPTREEEKIIFDIARPRSSQGGLPRLLKPAIPITYDVLKGKRGLMIEATEVLQGGRLWFGVGDPVAGRKNRIETVSTV